MGGLRINKKGCYTVKTYQNYLYTWCPEEPVYNKNTGRRTANTGKKYFCNATPGSQGEDWISTYCYNISVDGGIAKRIAYVECDYVQ